MAPVPPTADPSLDAVFAEVVGTPEGRRDPYERYRLLREAAPVYASGLGMVICTRYAECQLVLRDPRFGKAGGGLEEVVRNRFGHRHDYEELAELLSDRRSLLFLNPPDHTRLRGLVSKAFTPRTVEGLRPEIAAMVDGLLDEVVAGEVTDVISDLAFPLPANVISHMLGVPEEDWPRFRSVMNAAVVLLEPVIGDEELEAGLLAQRELVEYFSQLVRARRRHLGEDLLSHLIAVQEGGDRLSDAELISTAILLFGAGFETTTNLIGNGLHALLTHRDELGRLRRGLESGDRPQLLRLAVEELLRFDSPVQFDGRHAFEEVDLAGVPVPEGGDVVTILGAANRDPARFSDPDRLDLRREEGPPLSFASGIHFCLGAALARVEGQIVFGKLLDRFADMELASAEPEWKNRITLRGLAQLPVVFS